MTDKQFIYMLAWVTLMFGMMFFFTVKYCHSPECEVEIGEITHNGYLKGMGE